MFKSKKLLNIQIENNKIMNKRNIELNNSNIKLQKEKNALLEDIEEMVKEHQLLIDNNEINKKEIKRLKTLLTKNNIQYNKEVK